MKESRRVETEGQSERGRRIEGDGGGFSGMSWTDFGVLKSSGFRSKPQYIQLYKSVLDVLPPVRTRTPRLLFMAS